MGLIQAWSFSRWSTYTQCPLKLKLATIDKIQEPKTEPLLRGTELHEKCEKYLNDGGRIPKELVKIAPILKDLRKRGAVSEAEFAFNAKWQPVSWFSREAWCRVKADATILPFVDEDDQDVEVHDFKSGKLKEGASEYQLQLELYGLSALLTTPTAHKAKTSLIFIDHGQTVEGPVMLRKEIPLVKKRWEKMVSKMLQDETFRAKPGDACRWCFYSKNKNGNCKY